MEKNTRTKNILLVVLLVAVLTLSISYAFLTQTLNISSTAIVSSGGWNVKFTYANCQVGDGYTSNIVQFNSGNVSVANPADTLTGMSATFHAPGDSVVCDITVSNLGDIDATIQSFVLGDTNLTVSAVAQGETLSQADETLMSNALTYELEYATGDTYAGQEPGCNMTFEQGDDCDSANLIPHGQTGNTRNFRLTISYPDTGSAQSLPSTDVKIEGFNTVFTYKQV